MKPQASLVLTAILALPAMAHADSPFVEGWRDRAIGGALSSAKPSRSLQRCITSGLGGSSDGALIHREELGPRIVEIDTPARTFGVRIVDQGNRRVLIFVTDPRMTERGVAVLKGCV
ncbi:hypothetical protein [Sphingomonas sp. MMS24-J13]|uniref:hypothetical protein n=1 Tax=Sphingomonas sp. MMS24-J13 TaxID=3238686 RepID=UPI003850DFE9